ncbi:flagellar biosynthetic protein FliO [Bacillus sp. THAF10]|uniref:flagellar biosynthetic protein FliO n=1 Tax=Bacillus sp. THAF10 TaxID=2587848 RepID=UPI0012689EB4|nr:flagellar biosynthetic protein FliO [Bacillus sp. THAF10]
MKKRHIMILVTVIFMVTLPFQQVAFAVGDSVRDAYDKEKPSGESSDPDENNISDSEPVDKELVANAPSVTFFDFIKMIFALMFVLALLYLALKFINKRNKLGGTRAIETIGGTSLGANKSLQLVKVGDNILVVGVGESISLLKEITDEEERKRILTSYQEQIDSQALPPNLLANISDKWNHYQKAKRTSTFSSLLKEQLGKISEDRKTKMNDMQNKEGFKK